MYRIFNTLFNIKQNEVNKTLLMFSYIFLIIASLLIAKPVRNSLFLTHYGVHMLPWAFMLVAVFAAGIIELYTRMSKKVQFNKLIKSTLLISIFSLFVFWGLLKINYNAGWFFFVIYIWVALFGVITTSQFWLLANYVFDARQAKRLFGFIGSGAISGGIAGGYMTRLLAPVLGTSNMLLLCALFLIICIVLLSLIWQKDTRDNYTQKLLKEEKRRKGEKPGNAIKIISKSRHLSYLALIVGVGVMVANLVDFQFNAIASDLIKDKDKLTAFFGFWLSNLSVASLLIQMFLTGRIFKLFGVATSLYFLPVGILAGAISILLQPALWSAIIIKVADGGFKQSINKAGLELLTVPIPGKMKNQTKAFIDVFIDSLATGISGLLLIILVTNLHLSVAHLSIVIILLILVWLYLIIKVKSEYLNSFRLAIEKRSIDPSQQTTKIDDATMVAYFKQILETDNTRQLIYVLDLLENNINPQLEPFLQNLLGHKSHQIRLKTLEIIQNYEPDNFIDLVRNMLNDNHFDIKVEAILFLLRHDKESENLVGALISNSDYKICSAAMLAASIQFKNDALFRKKVNISDLYHEFIQQSCVRELNNNQMNFINITITKVIGISSEKLLYPYMLELLKDESISVVQSAIVQSGNTRDPLFIPALTEYLTHKTNRTLARNALAQYGEAILPEMDSILQNKETDFRLMYAIPKVLSLINSQESANILIKHLNTGDSGFRYRVLKALNKLRDGNPMLKFELELIEDIIFAETEKYYNLLSVHQFFSNNIQDLTEQQIKAKLLLSRSISERLEDILERTFRLLGLYYPPGDIYNAYLAVTSKQNDSTANAVEFLDNLLHSRLKKIILPLLEDDKSEIENKPLQMDHDHVIKDEADALTFLLNDNNSWLKSCAIYYISVIKNANYNNLIENLNINNDPLVEQTMGLYYKMMAN